MKIQQNRFCSLKQTVSRPEQHITHGSRLSCRLAGFHNSVPRIVSVKKKLAQTFSRSNAISFRDHAGKTRQDKQRAITRDQALPLCRLTRGPSSNSQCLCGAYKPAVCCCRGSCQMTPAENSTSIFDEVEHDDLPRQAWDKHY